MTANHAQYLSLLRGTWGLRGGVGFQIGLDWIGLAVGIDIGLGFGFGFGFGPVLGLCGC